MLLPVIAPKPQRLRSPRMDLMEEKELESVFRGVDRDTLTESHGSHRVCSRSLVEASREVERIMHHAQEELEQKSPIRPKPSYPKLFETMESPLLRSISPPARAPNPQAAAVEAYWRERGEVLGTRQSPQHELDSEEKEEDEEDAEYQFCHSLPLTSRNNELEEPSSPFSAPPSLPSLELSRHYSVSQGETSINQTDDEEDGDLEDGTILLSPNFYSEIDQDEQDRLESYFYPPLLTEYSPYHLPVVNPVDETRQRDRDPDEEYDEYNETCQHSASNRTSSRPIDIPSINRINSLPSRTSSSLSTEPCALNCSPISSSSKRKRGKPKYASRSLPSEISKELYKQIRRQ